MNRICTACLKNKPLSDFGKSKRGKDGHIAECKACFSERLKVLRLKRRMAGLCVVCGKPSEEADWVLLMNNAEIRTKYRCQKHLDSFNEWRRKRLNKPE